jgi:hypothetical protein
VIGLDLAIEAAFAQWGLPALERRVGWQPSRFLIDWAGAEHAFARVGQLGSVNAAAQELGPPGRRCPKRSAAMGWACRPATPRRSTSGPRPVASARLPAIPTMDRCRWRSTLRPARPESA